ncbi:hypothetical protein C5167_012269 [Papaver somniferum]|uniref:U1-type domain-containing protein n=1 Tax=Papaver somniferum TaxID=3469 RepID=A0A4Y7IX13_PAPSO|nr:uncharacterized protein LOC113355471 isoform X2 [Papaver somniferum]RZC53434.1 hypothetical protein C5167_012269 [Papaver somniferum]
MDLPSLTEAQQQQIQQLHQQFQEHQIQRQKQQQESAAAYSYSSYDPSSQHHFQSYNQSIQQSYDQSYHHPSYSHYPQPQQQHHPHHQHHHHHHQQQQQQHYPSYYHHDNSNAYHHHPQSYSRTDNTPPIHPPGVSYEAAAVASQNVYYHPHTQPLDNHPSTSSAYPGLNPAAAAAVEALSELTHFAGNMDAAERAMAAGVQDIHWNPNNELGGGGGGGGGGMYNQMPMPLQHAPYPVHFGAGRSSYNRGGVKRGARTFRGSSRANLGNRHSRPDGPVPYFHGRGRGGRRRFPSQCDSLSAFPEASAQKSDEASTHVKTGADELPQATPASASSTAATTTTSVQATRSTKRPPGITWCEICRLDCTTPDNLHQHKKGKKHNKKLLRFEEVQNSRNHTSNPTSSHDLPRIQSEKITTGGQEATAQLENIHPNESVNQPDLKSLATETTTPDDHAMDSEQQNKVQELAEVPEVDKDEGTTEGQKVDQFDTRKRGPKRNLRDGRGGKRTRMAENKISRVIKPPKQVLPFSCDLCNVKCDTQAVLKFHLVGKKHLSKVRRFQGHQAVYGPVGLQALYPPNPNTQPVFVPQEHQQQQQQAHVNISQQPIVANGMPLDGQAVAEMQQGL